MVDEFDALWSAASSEIARVEQRVDYFVPDDQRLYRRYLAGEQVRIEDIGSEWYSLIRETVARGVEVHRFRVFDLPLPDYQKYEIDWGYLVGAEFGQETWAIRRPLYQSLLAEEVIPACDFWSFDKNEIIVAPYDDRGGYLAEVRVTDAANRAQLKRALELVLSRAVSLADFLAAVGHEPYRFSDVLLDTSSPLSYDQHH